MTDVSPKDVLF